MRLERLEVFESWVTCLAKTAMSSLKESEEHTSPPATPGSRGVHVASSHFSKTRASRGKRGWLQKQQRQIESRNKAQITTSPLQIRNEFESECILHSTRIGFRDFAVICDLKRQSPVYRQIILSARLKFARQFVKEIKIKMHKLMRKKKCNACAKKKKILTLNKVSRKKNYYGKENPDVMQLTRKFDLYPSLTRRWQLSPCWWAWHWDGGHVCRSAGWRGAAVRDSDDGPAAAAEAREGPRTYRLRPCRRNEPTHRTGREAESQHKEHKKTRQSC